MLRAYWIVAQHPAQAHKLLHELKAEMEDDRLAPARKTLLIAIRPPLAPRALLETGKRGVVQAPLNHELLKVPGARPMHPKRSEWLDHLKHPGV